MSTRTLFVGAKRFPVEEIYLEDLCSHFGDKLDSSVKLKILEGIKCFNLKNLKAQRKDQRLALSFIIQFFPHASFVAPHVALLALFSSPHYKTLLF